MLTAGTLGQAAIIVAIQVFGLISQDYRAT